MTFDLESPALRLPAVTDAHRAALAEHGHLRLTEALAPGLAAELGLLSRLPLEVASNPVGTEVSWSGGLVVPSIPDPQNPPCLYRLLRGLDQELPAWAAELTGRPMRRARPGHIFVWILRKGCFADELAPLAADGLEVLVGLTGARWPPEWGGHLELLDEAHAPRATLAPGFATIDLYTGWRLRAPLLTHHVEALSVRAGLSPA